MAGAEVRRRAGVVEVFDFPSNSNPKIPYEAILYEDGSTSCNCKGWTLRCADDGSRSCRHTKEIEKMERREVRGERRFKTFERNKIKTRPPKHPLPKPITRKLNLED